MNEASDTVKLLDECCTGCKYGTNSMEQVMSYTKDERLKSLISRYNDKHISYGDRCHVLLNEAGKDERDPNTLSSAMAKTGTAIKLTFNSTTSRIAEILIDGCAMAAKNIAQKRNEYSAASATAKEMAQDLIDMSMSMMGELLDFV